MTNGKFSSQADKDAVNKRQRELLQSQLGLKLPPASS